MAMNTNIVTVTGNLTKDIEGKKVNEKNAVFTSTIAVNGYSENEVIFLPVEVWNKQGRAFKDNNGKGSRVAITGNLKQDRFTTKDGKDVTITKINATQVEFLGSPKNETDDTQGRAFGNKSDDLAF